MLVLKLFGCDGICKVRIEKNEISVEARLQGSFSAVETKAAGGVGGHLPGEKGGREASLVDGFVVKGGYAGLDAADSVWCLVGWLYGVVLAFFAGGRVIGADAGENAFLYILPQAFSGGRLPKRGRAFARKSSWEKVR